MIEIRKIKWRNFLSTGNVFTELNLCDYQLTLMVGKNGAGKSTLLDAVSFAFFGKPFRNINKNQLVNSINKKNTEVNVEFSIGNKQYVIKRGIKPTLFEIYCDGSLIDQNAEQKEYQEMLEKQILKLNHKSFNQVVILGSTSFVPFMQLTAANRREIIEDLLDIEIFSKMNVLLKDRLSKNKDDIQKADIAIKQLNTRIEIEEKHLKEKKQNLTDIVEEKNKQKTKINKQIKSNQSIVETLTTQYQEWLAAKQTNEKKLSKVKKLEDLKKQLQQKIRKIDDDIDFFSSNDNCPTCRQIIDNMFKSSTIESKQHQKWRYINGISDIDVQIQTYGNIDGLVEEQTSCINTINNQIMSAKMTIAVDQKLIENIDNDISILNVEDQSSTSVSEIQDLKTKLASCQQEYKGLLDDKQVLEVAGILLKDTGIKTKIIQQYIPVINKLINKYLASMDFFVNFELDENFEEQIKSRFRDEFVYESFSEGEKMRIDLALLFTWRSIAKLRNSISTNLLIMDEVFDSSLDNEGTDEFLKILNQLTKDNNTFIISHKGDQLADKFPNVIKFEKIKNFSRVVQ